MRQHTCQKISENCGHGSSWTVNDGLRLPESPKNYSEHTTLAEIEV